MKEIEDRQLNRAVFNIGDSTLADSVIRETFVNDKASSGKNSLKTGSANTKDAEVSAAENPSAASASSASTTATETETPTTQSIETTRINESVSEKLRDISEQRSKSTDSATEVIESISSRQSSHFSSKEDYSSKVIIQKEIDRNGSTRSTLSHSNLSEEDSPTVIVHHISKEDPSIYAPPNKKSQVITHHEEQSSSSTSHRATKNGVDLSKKTSTKAAESSTTQTLSFSNVRGQPSSSQIIYEPRKVMLDNFANISGPSRAIIHQISREDDFGNVRNENSKVIVHQISREENQRSYSSNESVITKHTQPQTTDYKLIVHQISPTSDRAQGSPRSTSESTDEHGKIINHSVLQENFAEKRLNIDQKDRFTQNVSKKDTKETQSEPSDKTKKVILIPIHQENSTQTSPLPSLSEENPLHSNLLEIIKDENHHSETKSSSKQSEISRQTSSSPLSRSPVICFENLSKSFELNNNKPDNPEEANLTNSAQPTAEQSPKVMEHPIRQVESPQKSPKRSDNLEPLKIPAFPFNRPSKVILHPIINETSGKPVFPYSEKSMNTIDTSSKNIANEILKEVSSELLKSYFILEKTKEELMEKVQSEPIRTSFPVSLKNQASFRPGFFETNKFEKQTNPLDSESKVIVHPISTNVESVSKQKLETETKLKTQNSSKHEEKVIVHQISRDESSTTYESKSSHDSANFTNNSHINSTPSSFPISIEKETHATQYTPRPQEFHSRTADLQSMRDSAKFHQTSSKMSSTFNETETKKEIIHEVLKERDIPNHKNTNKSSFPSAAAPWESKEPREEDKPKVILHPISKEDPTLNRSPSFPLIKEQTEASSSKKNSTTLKDSSFPVSSLKIHHPDQYNSKSTVLEQKSINIERLRNESKLIQSNASPFAQKLMEEKADQKKPQPSQTCSQEPSYTPFPVSVVKPKQSSFTSQSTGFPISVEKETHATQYKARPQDSQQKSIDLQSLRNSAELRQSSSTMTSTYGLTEIENKKEIIHEILKESSTGDLPSSHNSKSKDHVQKTQENQSTKKDQPKEIVHQIVKEHSASDLQQTQSQQTPSKKVTNKTSEEAQTVPKEIVHQIAREDSSSNIPSQTFDHQTSQDESISSSEGSVLTVIHNESPRSISPPAAEEQKPKEPLEEKSSKRSFFLPPIELPNKTQSEAVQVKQDLQIISPDFVKVLNHPVVRQIEKPLGYRVESPQPEKIPMLMKKSKSFDDDDVVIQEMSDTSSAGDTDNPPVISEAESETDTIEAVDDLPDLPSCSSLVSIQTLPMDSESSDNLSTKSAQEYKTRRQQNRAALESHFLPQFLAPNFLDSIKEENSDLSDSDRRSSCSDRVEIPVHQGDLEDDVFLDPPKKANAVYPKSNLDFSRKHKHVLNVRPPKTGVIREEASPPSVVEAKIIEQGSIEESCSTWSTDLTPESEAAEVVYINSASSSVSDLLELDYSQGQPDDSIDREDDVVRIQTPTIDLDSVNEMFATCQQVENNDRKIFIPPSEKPPPPPPVNGKNQQENNINQQNLSSSNNKNDLPNTTKLKLDNDEKQKCKTDDELIFKNTETKAGDRNALKSSDDVSTAGTLASADENSIANNLNSCDSAIDQIVTSNTSPSVSANANATAAANVVVGSNKNMENIREIVTASASSSASSKSELDTNTITDRTDHGLFKTNFMIGQPCSDHTLKCDTKSSSLLSSSSSSPSASASVSSCSSSSTTTTNTTTTTTTKILTLHDLSQALDNTKHLINPLVSPSSSALDRQESLDSHGSDQSHSTNQSQCTAINQGSLPHCDWNEIDTTTDTTYVSESDTAAGLASSEASSPLTTKGAHTSGDETESPPIRKLRSLCTEALASMPYGEEVLQELATVAQNIRDMPYPLPDLPQIQDIQLSMGAKPEKTSVITLSQVPPRPGASLMGHKFKSPPPPPVPEPPSKYDAWLGVPTESDPSVLVCLSPSQRNAVKSDSTADSLLDMHKKFVERRGYHEYTTKQVNAINQANTAEAPKLNKVDSPPPPPLPPRPPTQLSNPNGNADRNDDNDDEEDQNNHRLLAIIRDTHQTQQQQQQHQQKSSMTSTSENISRRTESGIHKTVNTSTTHDGASSSRLETEAEFSKTPCSVNNQSQERKFISENSKSHGSTEMHQQSESEHSMKIGGETVMGMKFPTSEYFDSIFAGKDKRFSNIEMGSRPEFCSQLLATQPKRYSNIETSSFESKKCVENGKVLYDVSDSKREKISEGDEPDSASVGPAFFPETSRAKTTNGLEGSFPASATANRSGTDDYPRAHHGGDSENIMSAFKLNTTQTTAPPAAAPPSRVESSPPAPPVPPLPPTLAEDTTATSSTMTTKSTSTSESHINRTFNAKTSEKTFDDFGQRAKEAASTNNTTNTSTGGGRNESSSTADKKPSDAFQHEKLFKEFDELSNLLKDELESGKRRPPATLNGNDIPSSVIDYNRVARESKIQSSHVSSTTSTETTRREQMKKLADEIDRTSKQKLAQRREMRIPIVIEKSTDIGPQSAPVYSQEPRSYDIPVRVEGGRGSRPNLQHQRSYEIPVRVEESSSNSRQRTYSEHQTQARTHEIPIQVEEPRPDRFRRAESMFNISDSTTSRHHLHHDDWMKYVGDIGSSENICKPFQREVEICYLGRRPNIRAPRMSASTSDLSSIQTFDTHGAYDVRRTAQTPRPQQPPRRSLIDTTPITSCVSARRSPAPERRSPLPREIHDRQLQYITSKEQQLKYEFERLENERRHLIDEMNRVQLNQRISREAYRQRQLPPLTEDESFRQQMAEEWLNKVAEREERRLQKIIKISKINQEAGVPVAPPRRHSAADDIGDEFLRRVKERRSKLHMPSDSDWESGAESQPLPRTDGSRSENEEPPVTVFEGHSTANIKQLPKHLREFAKLTSQMKEEHRQEMTENTSTSASKMTSQKTTVKMTSNNNSTHESHQSMQQDVAHVRDLEQQLSQPQSQSHNNGKRPKLVTILRHKKPAECSGGATHHQSGSSCNNNNSNNTNSAIKRRKQTRFLLTPNRRSWSESDLLREIDRDLVLAKGFLYANVFSVKNEYMSEPETEYEKPKKMAQLSRRQYDGIGPTTKDGMPVVLRSEVKEPNQHEWYKRIFQTIHKQKNPDDYVTIRYKCPRGRYPYKANGYMSEPEPNYDSDYSTVKYRTLERRRLQSIGGTESRTSAGTTGNESRDETFYGTMPNPVKSGQGSYKVQPGRIENYITGHSSVSEKEKKEWWDEVMDIFKGQLDQQKLSPHYTEGNLSRALLKEQGYTSDSNLVFRKKDVPILQSPLSPVEQKQVYKSVQAGGQPPLLGFRKPAPEKPKESPNRYFESDVNIHYKTPIRYEYKDPIPEEELAIRQAETMQKLYQEERRRKYLQELQDMNSRRHTDNFTPSQKSPIPLNRYDDFNSDLAPKSPNNTVNYPRTVARALYNFQGQTARELTFKKGDVIYIRRQIDKNWYEGEHNAMIGLLPSNYVELLTKDGIRQPPKKPSEGQARAKYNFQAQSGIELSLNKGEHVTLTRRVDENWYEGKIANRKGIFPVSYVEVLVDIGAEDRAGGRLPVTQSIITQTSSSSMRPSLDTLRTNINNEFNSLTSNGQPPNGILRETRSLHKTEVLHVDTNADPVAYRALYKYRPQNTDELELHEGDIVFVLEKCDDGWFVGTSERTGCFGTFPGNYVERV